MEAGSFILALFPDEVAHRGVVQSKMIGNVLLTATTIQNEPSILPGYEMLWWFGYTQRTAIPGLDVGP